MEINPNVLNLIYHTLQTLARAGQTISYGKLAAQFDLHPYTQLPYYLGECTGLSYETDSILISAIVHDREFIVGDGFINLAEELTQTKIKDKEKFWVDEVRKCFAFYKNK